MSELSRFAATLKIASGADEPLRRSKKQYRMDARTAIGTMSDLRPIIIELVEREETLVDPSNGSSRSVRYLRATGNLLAATVLQALVTETGLKLLYELENPSELAADHHDFQSLFEQLSPSAQDRLAAKYQENVQAYGFPGLSQDLRAVLGERSRMFVLWRYVSEGASGPGYTGELIVAVDAMIDLAKELEQDTGSRKTGEPADQVHPS